MSEKFLTKRSSANEIRAELEDKPYPRCCADCGLESVVMSQIAYKIHVKHDGKLHEFPISNLTIDLCQSCGEEYFTVKTDHEISRGLRSHLGVQPPSKEQLE